MAVTECKNCGSTWKVEPRKSDGRELCGSCHDGKRYKLVRYYQRGGRRTLAMGLTLEMAQRHCNNPETSSSTAKSSTARRRTRAMGEWFDGYTSER